MPLVTAGIADFDPCEKNASASDLGEPPFVPYLRRRPSDDDCEDLFSDPACASTSTVPCARADACSAADLSHRGRSPRHGAAHQTHRSCLELKMQSTPPTARSDCDRHRQNYLAFQPYGLDVQSPSAVSRCQIDRSDVYWRLAPEKSLAFHDRTLPAFSSARASQGYQ